MNKLRIEQWKSEPADLFALRALAKALPHMDVGALEAFWLYVWKRSEAELRKRS